jgi:hypothetical protein
MLPTRVLIITIIPISIRIKKRKIRNNIFKNLVDKSIKKRIIIILMITLVIKLMSNKIKKI